ncbi:DUF4238 domain-containing protein [Marinoscillum sp. 108]|uniref:DUF4238 domain-containing protein n=1 Tax=Marinoscillum sp. 108 TaxID=2653151 RepID=UPI0012F07A7E|nr:DUF4238 domain-containing protein [Marinoscillum sp. 108]VXD14301.1 hypothetical protein MARINOS108_11852 [Marinoscillum sp. 108]
MGQKKKKQHFVPKLYLRNFTNSSGKIFAFDLQENKSFPTTVDNIAHDRYFYDFEPIDSYVGEQVIENSLADFEGDAAELLDKMLQRLDNGSLEGHTPEERILLAEYISIQMHRTPESRKKYEHFGIELERQLKAKGVSGEFIKQRGLSQESIDPKTLQLYGLTSMMSSKKRILSLCDRIWVYWENLTQHEFYASDHPVVGYTYRDVSETAYEIFSP